MYKVCTQLGHFSESHCLLVSVFLSVFLSPCSTVSHTYQHRFATSSPLPIHCITISVSDTLLHSLMLSHCFLFHFLFLFLFLFSGVPGGSLSLCYFLRKTNKTINTHLFILINITDIAICFLMAFVGKLLYCTALQGRIYYVGNATNGWIASAFYVFTHVKSEFSQRVNWTMDGNFKSVNV